MNKLYMGYLSVAITLIGYTLYISSMYRARAVGKQIKPHPLSWALFGFLTAIGWLAQETQGGYAGSWCLGITSLFCFIIAGLSFKKYSWRFEWKDWIWVVMGMILFFYSILITTPTLSVVFATLADLAGYGPTLRKGWREPYTDSPVNFAFNSVKCVPAFLALSHYSWATCMYLIMLTIMNGGVTAMLLLRRLYVR